MLDWQTKLETYRGAVTNATAKLREADAEMRKAREAGAPEDSEFTRALLSTADALAHAERALRRHKPYEARMPPQTPEQAAAMCDEIIAASATMELTDA